MAMAEGDDALLRDLRKWAERIGEGLDEKLPDTLRNRLVFPRDADPRRLVAAIETVILDLLGTWDQRLGMLRSCCDGRRGCRGARG